MAKDKIKVGLVLGSGGVKGLAHIGVIKVLAKHKIPIDCLAGSSIGALIGAGYAAYLDIKKIEDIVLAHNWKTAFDLFDPTLRGGLIAGRKVGRLINSWLGDLAFKDLKIPLTVVTTDLISGREVDIKQGQLVKAVSASLAVPPVFKPVEFNNLLLSDGGLCNPLPIDVVKKMGADFVIAVNLDGRRFNQNGDAAKSRKHYSLPRISIRALNIIRYHLVKKSLALSDIVIEPSVPEIGLVGWNKFFDNRQVTQLIKAGETAAEAALPEIKKRLNLK